MSAKTNVLNLSARQLANTVDRFGALDKQIKALQKQRDDLKELIIEQGDGAYKGRHFEVVVAISSRTTLDTGIAKSLLTPAQLQQATVTNPTITCRVKEL